MLDIKKLDQPARLQNYGELQLQNVVILHINDVIFAVLALMRNGAVDLQHQTKLPASQKLVILKQLVEQQTIWNSPRANQLNLSLAKYTHLISPIPM